MTNKRPSGQAKQTARPKLKDYDFENSPGYWLVIAARSYQKAFDAELVPHGLTYRQAQVLGWLSIDGDLSQVELADRMMIEPATLVGVLDRMERQCLIQRTALATDRRKKVIQLCDGAEMMWDNIIQCAIRVRKRASEGLTDRQMASFFKTLKTIMQNLEQAPSESESRP
ncbi:MarR family transcriptional regulator [Stieleria sp. JC731]|uniref:MarR family winged helix-turn-helix transcriptional regulator n=1 Tax=Pirellulaceae TaxID=2691357 RepID=UPI001E313C7C|nr:MarR family transcriptional regulator [Stieleria sp. JC731]MCC9603307.1 MarR family transcriptional regulator [Stieleria sp. JC731]